MYCFGKGLQGIQENVAYECWRLNAKFANFVFGDSFVYSLDDGILTCMEASTGKRQWKKATMVTIRCFLVRDMFLVQAEEGSLNLIHADPSAHVHLANMSVWSVKS